MRGKANSTSPHLRRRRITPACAGKRALSRAPMNFLGDHPRVCGEKQKRMAEKIQGWGSPPRVRGKGRRCGQRAVRGGITPACAGKRPDTVTPSLPHWDHPRVCGEKDPFSGFPLDLVGSPPRVRGKEILHFGLLTGGGDHPRVCGEKLNRMIRLRDNWGSPPRVRGKDQGRRGRAGQAGITPACAGKRRDDIERIAKSRDHPRVCGEKGYCHESL